MRRSRYGAVVLRLLLSIVALLMAVPTAAAPACHEAAPIRTATAMLHQHDGHPAPDRSTSAALHDCIGCIPPSNWIGSALAEPLPASGAGPRPLVSVAPDDRALKPTPPPPRQA